MASKESRRFALAEAQNWRCAHCQGDMLQENNQPDSVTIEHIVPLGNGGLRLWGNEVAAHARCNAARGSTSLDPVSTAIAMELMGGERRLQQAATLRKARAKVAEAEIALLDAVTILRDQAADPEAEMLLRRVESMLTPSPHMPRLPSGAVEMLVGIHKAASRLYRRITIAIRAAAQAWRADRLQGVGHTPADAQADWRRRYGSAFAAHIGRRPKGYAREQWRVRFFLAFPDALNHPGCPAPD